MPTTRRRPISRGSLRSRSSSLALQDEQRNLRSQGAGFRAPTFQTYVPMSDPDHSRR